MIGLTTNDQQEIRTALALHIPDFYSTLSLSTIETTLDRRAEFDYAVYQRIHYSGPDSTLRRFPNRGFVTGSVFDLGALLPVAALHKEDIERVADDVARMLIGAAEQLERTLPGHFQALIMAEAHQRSPLAAFRTIMILWLNALLIQSTLNKQQVQGIESAFTVNGRLPIPSKQIRIWTNILKQNWHSVFAPAVEALRAASDLHSAATASALNIVNAARETVEVARLGLHINVGAELFPKLSEDRKEAAAFYTQAATAELLAGLTIRYDDCPQAEWADPTFFLKRTLADLACGTGTLLRAGYRKIATFHEASGGSENTLRQFHRTAMESGLRGADVSPIAAHLTSSSLAAIGAGEAYGNSQIGWVDVGGRDARTGSLEYFRVSTLSSLFRSGGGISAGRANEQMQAHNIVNVGHHSVDWILMNPPYSRTRKNQSAFDIQGLTDAGRSACQKRWGALIKSEPCIKTAGMAASFLALARRKVKPGGRIGFVLPLTAALAKSWEKTRRMVEQDFTDIIAVAVAGGQALGRDALSADTMMEEMLLVCTRKGSDSSMMSRASAQIKCVTLYYPPSRVGEAGEIARAVLAASKRAVAGSVPIMLGGAQIGHLYVHQTNCKGAPWSPLGARHSDLARAAVELSLGTVEFDTVSKSLGIEMTTMASLFVIGPTHHLIGSVRGADRIGAFEMNKIAGPNDALGRDRALWYANSKVQQTLVVLPTHKGSAPSGFSNKTQRQMMREFRSRLFYSRNMRWTSQALLAAMTERKVMGGTSWTSLEHPDERILKAFALWANSTLGMLVHWTRGQRTQPGRARTQIKAIKEIPCPRLSSLSDVILDQVSNAFDKLRGRRLLPACQAHADEVRITIDSIVLDMLGLDDEVRQVVDVMRWLWCNEPSVYGTSQAAKRLLRQKALSDRWRIRTPADEGREL